MLHSVDFVSWVKRQRRLVVLRVSDGKSFLVYISFFLIFIFKKKLQKLTPIILSSLPAILASMAKARAFVPTARLVGIQIPKQPKSALNAS